MDASTWHGGATRELAAFVAGTRYADVPQAARDRIKALILDTLGVTIAGAGERAPRIVAELVLRYGGPPVSTVIGMPFRTDPASAAWINGTSAHALDYDDVSFAASAHPSVCLVPAILALADEERCSGAQVISAYAVGFEAAVLLGRTINPDHYAHGWHGTGTVGALAATFASANLLGLNEREVIGAIGIAVSSASGVRQNFGTDVKPFHAGNTGRVGVTAARLAQHGMAGHAEILEGKLGFFNVFGPGPAREHPRPPGRLGGPWAVLEPGITTKDFPSCASTHTAVDMILGLRAEGLRADDVHLIEVTLPPITAGNLHYPEPRNGLEAKFSLQYCVSRGLIDGPLKLEHFTDRAATEDAVGKLASRVVMHVDPDMGAEAVWGAPRQALMRVRTATGEVLERRATSDSSQCARDRLLAKFDDCIQRGGFQFPADRIVAVTETLDSCSDITALTGLLTGVGGGKPAVRSIVHTSRSSR